MLQPAWYLPDTDWFAQLPGAPRLTDDHQAIIGHLARLLRDEPTMDPTTTVAATHAILLAVEHLGETMAYAAAAHNSTEVARLLCGLALTEAHLTQAIQRLAIHVNRRTFTGLGGAPGDAVQVLADCLSAAGVSGELLTGHLKEADLILRSLTQ